MFVVNPILGQLVLRAAARVLALAALSITLTRSKAALRIPAACGPHFQPNDRQLWLKLLHLDLEAHPPQAAIVAVIARPSRSTSKMQLGLFTPQMPEPAHLDVTLARIRAFVPETKRHGSCAQRYARARWLSHGAISRPIRAIICDQGRRIAPCHAEAAST